MTNKPEITWQSIVGALLGLGNQPFVLVPCFKRIRHVPGVARRPGRIIFASVRDGRYITEDAGQAGTRPSWAVAETRRSKGEHDMRAFKAASVLALAVLTVSCTGNPSWGGTIGLKSFGLVSGNGKVTTEERAVSGFTAVSLSGSGSLRVHEGGFKVEVIADSNILPYIVTELVGTELRIGFKPGIGIARTTRLEFDVTMPGLAGIRVSGLGQMPPSTGSPGKASGRKSPARAPSRVPSITTGPASASPVRDPTSSRETSIPWTSTYPVRARAASKARPGSPS